MVDLLGLDGDLDEHAAALRLAEGHRRMLRELVTLRRTGGLSTAEVARALGWDEVMLYTFEAHDANPTLGQIRRYAFVVGAEIDTTVRTRRFVPDPGRNELAETDTIT